MITDYDIKCCLENVCQYENRDRLLWFARIRNYMLQATSTDIQLGIRLIIIRFKKECLTTPRIAHWLLNILQMCVLHCTPEFLVALNDTEVLEPFREVLSNRYDEVLCLKLSTLLKTWHEEFKHPYPDSACKKTCEAISFQKRFNLHWFPNKSIVDQPLDSVSYDLEKVGNELLDHSNAQLSHLNAFCADHNSPIFANWEDPEKRAKMTLEIVGSDLRFWEDIVQHTGLPDESLQGLRKVQSDVQQIVRNLKKKLGTMSSCTGEYGSAGQSNSLQLDGGNRGPDRQSAQPTASGYPSHPGWQGNCMQVQTQPWSSIQQPTGEVRTSVHQSEPPSQRASTWSTHSSASAGSAPQSTQPEGHQPANIDLQKWVCSICKCDFQEEKDYVTHISTDEHLQLESNISKHTPASRDSVTHSPQPQARQRANRDQHRWICSVCKCEFQEEKDYIDHLSTQEHLQLESRESVPRSTQPEDCQRVSRDQHKWMCSICQCDFQDEKEYIEHLSSKKHESKSSKHSSKSRVLMPSATRKWVCSICQREFQHENDYTTHITSKKHIAKEQASTANPASSVPQKEALAPGLREHPTNAPSSQPKGDYEESQLEWNTSTHFSTSSALVSPSRKHEGRQKAKGVQYTWMCPICRIGFHEKEDYIRHLSSSEHKQVVAALPPLPTE